MRTLGSVALSLLVLLPRAGVQASAQQVTGQDLDKVLERADQLLEEAKAAYEEAHSKNSVAAYVDAGFKLEEVRIKYLVLQEIGGPDKQKIAADRLRAVNQLSKLVHDGKVAITGGPAESPPPAPAPAPRPANPSPVPPPNNPSPVPPPPAPKAPVDVMKRAAIPEAAKQKEAEKLVRDLFKDQYAKKAPADRRALAKLLLDQAAKSQDDPVALWVLFREAQDAAVQVPDARVAIEAIEGAARFFDVDSLSMKSSALTAAAKAGKTPEEFSALAEATLKVIDELVRADQFDLADKTAATASAHARKSGDASLAARTAVRAKEVSEAKTLFQSMKSVHETLAKSPDDPGANLEIGKFLCFVKGSWDLGLRFMAKGSDPALKALAEKEIALPMQIADRVALADGWYDLGEKEKSPLRKSQLLAHAKSAYESAVIDAPALVRAKIEKRLDAMESAGIRSAERSSINLLRLIDVKQEPLGDWTFEGGALFSDQNLDPSRVLIPYSAPDEYDITAVVERQWGRDAVLFGLTKGSVMFNVWIDGHSPLGGRSGLENIDGMLFDKNPASIQGFLLTNNKPSTVVIQVRKAGITATLDGKTFVNFQGNYNRLSMAAAYWKVSNWKGLFVGTCGSRYHISKLTLTPVTGQGKRLR